MFSAILMVAMTTGVQAPEFFFKNKAESCGTPVVVSSCSGCCGGREGVMARLHDKADKKGCCGGEVVGNGCCGGREGIMTRLHDKLDNKGCYGGEAGGRRLGHHRTHGCCGG